MKHDVHEVVCQFFIGKGRRIVGFFYFQAVHRVLAQELLVYRWEEIRAYAVDDGNAQLFRLLLLAD